MLKKMKCPFLINSYILKKSKFSIVVVPYLLP